MFNVQCIEMKVLVATEKPFAAAAVEGIRKEVEAAGNELVLLALVPDTTTSTLLPLLLTT